jgi:hypothetical protein
MAHHGGHARLALEIEFEERLQFARRTGNRQAFNLRKASTVLRWARRASGRAKPPPVAADPRFTAAPISVK